MKKTLTLFALMLTSIVGFGQEQIDYDVINKIKEEGITNSHMEEIAFYLTDYSGPPVNEFSRSNHSFEMGDRGNGVLGYG